MRITFYQLLFISSLLIAWQPVATQAQETPAPATQAEPAQEESEPKEKTKDKETETKSPQQIAFEAVDSDSNGKISPEELRKHLQEKYLEVWVEELDTNGNGEISEREFKLRRQIIAQLVVAEEDDELLAMRKYRRKQNGKDRKSAKAKPKKQPMDRVASMNAGYLKRDPKLGKTIEKLRAYDESGEKLDFKDLRGKHTVLVFGCLT